MNADACATCKGKREVLWIYPRGPNDPPGNMMVPCPACIAGKMTVTVPVATPSGERSRALAPPGGGETGGTSTADKPSDPPCFILLPSGTRGCGNWADACEANDGNPPRLFICGDCGRFV